MNKTFFAVVLIVAIGFSSTTAAAYALSETERYNSGYSHGYMDAKKGATSYCSISDHTYTYCQGYNAGYQAGKVQTQQIPSSPSSSYSIGSARPLRTRGGCPSGMYEDYTDGILHCHDAHGTRALAPTNLTSPWKAGW